MQNHRNEITTGILVLTTLGLLLGVLVVMGIPGLIHPLNTFRIYFDNAAGIRPGAPVLLAGREIGKVTHLASPVPMESRPPGHENFEVCIDVRVSADAQVYKTVTARLAQQGLMGQQVIDFIKGDASSGLATNNTEFVGQRVPEVSELMNAHMERLTGPDSDLALAVKGTRTFIDTLNKSEIPVVIDNARKFTATLHANTEMMTGRDSDLAATVGEMREFMENLNGSDLSRVIRNSEQLTDTLKRQPWRLLWPSTKHYADEPATSPAPSVLPRPKKSQGRTPVPGK